MFARKLYHKTFTTGPGLEIHSRHACAPPLIWLFPLLCCFLRYRLGPGIFTLGLRRSGLVFDPVILWFSIKKDEGLLRFLLFLLPPLGRSGFGCLRRLLAVVAKQKTEKTNGSCASYIRRTTDRWRCKGIGRCHDQNEGNDEKVAQRHC